MRRYLRCRPGPGRTPWSATGNKSSGRPGRSGNTGASPKVKGQRSRAEGIKAPLLSTIDGRPGIRIMRVSIQNLTKKFGDTVVLQNVSLEVNDCELFFLLGPSGCGKTTLLRLIAGFYHPDAGRIFFGEKPMDGVPAHRRNTG